MNDSGMADPSDFSTKFRRRALLLLSLSLFLLLGHAFVPLEEFLHRGDDAYYYFKLAANWPEYHHWTFDGLHRSNGVQPLWGIMLSATAEVFAWVGVTDFHVLARIFVFETALLHFVSGMLVFRILSRHVSLGAAIGAAGGLLFPLGIVWTRVWGMENSLYCVVLLSTVLFYQEHFRERGTRRNAVLLGLLLGTTTIARLNSGFLIPILLAFYLASGLHGSLRERLRLSVVVGAVASALILPCLGFNIVTTGHLLPVAGGAKLIRAKLFLQERGVETMFSTKFLAVLRDQIRGPGEWFVTSRAMDGFWLGGGRLMNLGKSDYSTVRWILVVCLLLPLLALRPLEWLRTLGRTFRRLGVFSYVLAFALLNTAISVSLYPYEATYSIVRWWLVEGEVVITTVVATLVATSIGFLGARWIPKRFALNVATVLLAVLVAISAGNTIRFYWDGESQYPDWNISTNDQRYLAALWINENLPDDVVIGSWNAGVIGYYTKAHVVNLDGLINDWAYLPYLERNALAEYIRDEGIQYLADTDFELSYRAGKGLREELGLKAVYSRVMDAGTGLAYRQQAFIIYEVPEALKSGE